MQLLHSMLPKLVPRPWQSTINLDTTVTYSQVARARTTQNLAGLTIASTTILLIVWQLWNMIKISIIINVRKNTFTKTSILFRM